MPLFLFPEKPDTCGYYSFQHLVFVFLIIDIIIKQSTFIRIFDAKLISSAFYGIKINAYDSVMLPLVKISS